MAERSDWSGAHNDITTSQSDSEDGDHSSDVDYSPGRLVIDTGTGAGSANPTPIASPSFPSSSLPSSSHPLTFFTTITTPTLSPPLSQLLIPPSPEIQKKVVSRATGAFGGVSLSGQKAVASAGLPPIDTICLYTYLWGDIPLDIISKNDDSLIPVKNIYEKVIPGLKRNVLSARISKLGIRSVSLTEPYVSTLKRLGLQVTGSSHYVSIMDFVKICKYFKSPPPENLTKFCFINSQLGVEEVLKSFDGANASSGGLLGQNSILDPPTSMGGITAGSSLTKTLNQSDLRGRGTDQSRSNLGMGPGGSNYCTPISSQDEGSVEGSGSSQSNEAPTAPTPTSTVDARRLVLPTGDHIILLIREGLPFIANTELPKVLPNVNPNRMDNLRNSCGISVQHASKTEVAVLKHLGAVGGKAGRSALYKAADVGRLFLHYNIPVPMYIQELCEGKFPEEVLSVHLPLHHHSHSHSSRAHPPVTTTTQPYSANTPSTLTAIQTNQGEAIQMEPNHPQSMRPIASQHHATSSSTHSNLNVQAFSRSNMTPHSQYQYGFPPYSNVYSYASPSVQRQPLLAPEHFQQPVQMLNSFQQAQGFSVSPYQQKMVGEGGMGGRNSPWNFMSPSGMKLDISMKKRRRSSSSSGPALQDQDLQYSSLPWGLQTLSLLSPPDEEPYLAVPELINKVFHDRSYVSAQRRSKLGIVTVPATSLQIHALRARGSLDAFTGNTKLLSLCGAVKLAANRNLQIPPNVLQECMKFTKESVGSLLRPAIVASPSMSHSHMERRVLPAKQEMMSQQEMESEEWAWSTHGIPTHPNIIDLGPTFRTADGVVYQVSWGSEKLVVYLSHKKANYMGLFQVYEVVFKQYVNRMNFKMRMRKLDIRSIRAPSAVRLKLIELNALPPHSPVCGLIKISEMERLAKSYGVVPPNVFYEVFLSKHLGQQASLLHGHGRPKKHFLSQSQPPMQRPNLASQGTSGHIPGIPFQLGMEYRPPLHAAEPMQQEATDTESIPHMRITFHPDEDSLVVSIPRHITRFNLPPVPRNPPWLQSTMQGAVSQPHSNFSPPPFRGYVLQNLAKRISQKTKKLGVSSSARHCPACHRINPAMKKRCQFCGEFLIGRPCPQCGTLNHNRTKDCFKCNTPIPFSWQKEVMQSSMAMLASTLTQHPEYAMEEATPPELGQPSHQQEVGTEGERSEVTEAMEVTDQSGFPSSPTKFFAPPPIRSAALKSMFPQEAQRQEDGQVMTKTIYSGNLASARKCQECGQLNSKMAKKCTQCRSPLQGKPCPRCGRPNLNHTLECYKCGSSLPPTASKWVYVGSHSGRAYKTTHDASRSPVDPHLESRAPISCIRCHRMRTHQRLKCGRCGDVFTTRPVVNPGEEGGEEGQQTTARARERRKDSQDGAALSLFEEEPASLTDFAHNLVTLEIGEQLIPIITEVESQSREKVYAAEEEYEDLEEKYQEFFTRQKAKEQEFRDAQAELYGLIAEVDDCSSKLGQLKKDEDEASLVIQMYPQKISDLQNKIQSAEKLIMTTATV